MSQHGKKYREAAKQVDTEKHYLPADAVKMVKDLSFAKFDETVELHIRTGVDPRHADQLVRGSAALPAGTGRTQRVLAFAEGDRAREAEAAGADVVGLDELVERIQGGWLDFDVAVATREAMPKISRVARILGPRGLMPNPRNGTVTDDLTRAIHEIKSGRVDFRVDRTGVVHVPIGKVSFSEQDILRNLAALVDAVVRAKPTGAKGQYVRSVAVSSTMGPGVHLDIPPTLELASGTS